MTWIVLFVCGGDHGRCIVEVDANLMVAEDINEPVLLGHILPKDHL